MSRVSTGVDPALAGPLPNEVETRLPGTGGTGLRVLAWPVADPRGRVQVVHGLSEHLGRYRGLASALNAAGYSVWGHDHRGHGESEGRRGVVGRFQDLVTDVEVLQRLGDECAPGPGRPVLLGHSLGGLVVLRALQTRPAVVEGAAATVLSAPWLGTAARIPLHTRLALPLLRAFAPDLAVPRPIEPETLTRLPEFAEAYRNDPLVVRKLAVSFFDQVCREQEEAMAGGLPEGLPALVIIPGEDQAADPRVTRRWTEAVAPRPEVWELPHTRHEPFNDAGRNNIFDRLVHWLNATLHTQRKNP